MEIMPPSCKQQKRVTFRMVFLSELWVAPEMILALIIEVLESYTSPVKY